MISIPSNQQTYALAGVTLSELSLSNIVAKDSSAIAEWTAALDAAGGSTGDTGDTGGGGDTGSGDTGNGDTSGGGGDTGGTDATYAPAWTADQVYLDGDRASVGNEVFEANWWTQGTDPQSDNGAVGTGHVWTFIGHMDTTPVAPETPEDFHALNTTETTTLLTWDAAEVNGVGTVSAYAIYENGELIGTTDSTYYKVTGLTADTTYSFSVVAIDEAGASPAATPITVTTDPLGSDTADDQSFSPYVDMALTSSADLVQIVDDVGLSAVTLAFMLSSGTDQIGWQGNGTIADDTLANGTTIQSIVDQLQQKGVDVTISFGGAAGQEAALTFSSAEALTAAYQSVIDKYHVTKLDFDIEGSALVDDDANHLRNEAIASLQEANPDLEISFTLPVLPVGLTQDGLDFLSQAKADGVDIDVVNIMTMDYGAYYESGDMGQDAIDATEATLAQLQDLGINAKIGITPMIGINDIQSEVFTLEDAQQIVDYANSNENVASIAMWSLSRDSGDTVGYVSSFGSGIEQQDYDFSKIFAHV